MKTKEEEVYSKREKECKHEFIHVSQSNFGSILIIIYCKKCGIDADRLHNKWWRINNT